MMCMKNKTDVNEKEYFKKTILLPKNKIENIF